MRRAYIEFSSREISVLRNIIRELLDPKITDLEYIRRRVHEIEESLFGEDL